MIYYNDEPVNWNRKTGLSEIDRMVADEITVIRNKYFADNTMQRVKVLYPRGIPEEAHRVFAVFKKVPVPLRSADGMWRYSPVRATKGKYGMEYPEAHAFLMYEQLYTAKDIEFLWFLMNRCSMLNRLIFIEDKEADAKKEIEQLSTDADIRYMLLGNSPIAKDAELIKQVASVLGVKDIEKRSLAEVKLDLFNTVVEGEKNKDAFCNYKKFEELTMGSQKRKAAFYARQSILDGTVGYKDRAWYLMSGREYSEKLLTINAKDAAYRDQLFIEEVVTNPTVKSRLFSAIGQEEITSAEDLRDIDRNTLIKKCKENGLEGKPSDDKETLIERLCKKYGIEYSQSKSA